MNRILNLLGALAVAFVVRIWHVGRILLPDGVFPSGSDPYYHLRRVHLALENGFAIPHHDLFCHFPAGVIDPWPPLFDWLLAALAWLAGGGAPSPETVTRVSVWVPPMLGVITVALVYALGRRLIGRAPALAAAWIYACLPAAAYRAQIGMADHHVAEVLLAVTIYLVLARDARAGDFSLRRSLGLGLALGAAVLTWLGAVIFVSVAFGYLLFRTVFHAPGPTGRAAALTIAVSFGLAGLLVLPLGISTLPGRAGEMRVYHLSLLQPALLLIMAGAGAITSGGWSFGRRGPRPRTRVVLMTGAGCLLGAAALLALGGGRGLGEGFAFARQATPRLLLPLESRPLFFPTSGFNAEYAWLLFHLAGVAAVIGWLLLLTRRPRRVEPLILLALLFGVHLVLALFQVRFTHFLAVDIALLAGVTAARIIQAGGRAGGTLLVGLLLVAPGGYFWITRFAPSPPPPAVRSALLALGRTSPPVSRRHPEYGVAAVWDLGHWTTGLARRPCLDSPFLHLTPFKGTAGLFMAQSGDAAESIAERYCVRYLVSVPIPVSPYGADGEGDLEYRYLYPRQFIQILGLEEGDFLEVRQEGLGITPAFARTLQFRLQYLNGVRPLEARHPAFPNLGPEMFEAPTLRRWRLHIAEDDPELPGEASRIKIFERVAGARVMGELVPGARIIIRAIVRSPHGDAFAFAYADRATADSAGRFTFRVPYWVRESPRESGLAEGFTLLAPSLRWERRVEVTEAEVREGRIVVVP
jgi:asparagine N-glycosylation enzyme membrane subunit Stt3